MAPWSLTSWPGICGNPYPITAMKVWCSKPNWSSWSHQVLFTPTPKSELFLRLLVLLSPSLVQHPSLPGRGAFPGWFFFDALHLYETIPFGCICHCHLHTADPIQVFTIIKAEKPASAVLKRLHPHKTVHNIATLFYLLCFLLTHWMDSTLSLGWTIPLSTCTSPAADRRVLPLCHWIEASACMCFDYISDWLGNCSHSCSWSNVDMMSTMLCNEESSFVRELERHTSYTPMRAIVCLNLMSM